MTQKEPASISRARPVPHGMRARLVAEAERLVRKRGYSGFSYADLSEAVGIRKASIHHHFPAKEDLGAALIQGYRDRYDSALASICEACAPGVACIEAYAALYREGLRQDQGCLCGVMACEQDVLPQRLKEAISRFFDAHLKWLERVMAAGAGEGTVRRDIDPRLAAKLVLVSLQGALTIGRLSGQLQAFDAAAAALVKSLVPCPGMQH